MNRSKNAKIFRKFALKYFPYCQWCKEELTSINSSCDHLMPLSRGGSNGWENYCISCLSCNNKKGSKLITVPNFGPKNWAKFRLDLKYNRLYKLIYNNLFLCENNLQYCFEQLVKTIKVQDNSIFNFQLISDKIEIVPPPLFKTDDLILRNKYNFFIFRDKKLIFSFNPNLNTIDKIKFIGV